MSIEKWTVARYPSGNWDTGGAPDCPDYRDCEVFVVAARSREEAKKRAQQQRRKQMANQEKGMK